MRKAKRVRRFHGVVNFEEPITYLTDVASKAASCDHIAGRLVSANDGLRTQLMSRRSAILYAANPRDLRLAAAWGNGIMLAAFNVQLRMPRRYIELLPTLQAMLGRSFGFVIDGTIWTLIGTCLAFYVLRRTSTNHDPQSNDS